MQEPEYTSWSVERAHGSGRYSVVTTRELAEEEGLERLGTMPLIGALVPFNSLLVPKRLEGDDELLGFAENDLGRRRLSPDRAYRRPRRC